MTKSFLSLFVLIASSFCWAFGGGSAGGNGDSLTHAQLVQLNSTYMIDMPAINFDGHQVGVINLCVGGTEVRTINPVLVSKLEMDRRNQIISQPNEYRIYSMPLLREVVDCKEFKGGWCSNYATKVEAVTTEFHIEAYERPRGKNDNTQLRYKVQYSLPSCSEL